MPPDFDPRDVRVADVRKAGRLAANLSRESGGVVFSYEASYLAQPGPVVATTLPLVEEPVRTPGGALPPFFSGLLPEGRRLTNLRQAVKTSADDELSLLLAVGDDPVGDVQVVPHGVEPNPGSAAPKVEGSFEDLDFADLLSDAGLVDPSALAGVQDKVSGRMLTVPLAHQGRAHFLKLAPPEYPHVVENESYFLGVARRLRTAVVTTEVVHDRHGRSGLLVTRFDRRVAKQADGSESLESLAVEDAAQLLGRYPADKYTVTMEQVASRVGEVCAARPLALRSVFVQLCLAWLTGNGDLHAKNVSVVYGPAEWRVSPIYDIPSTLPYRDFTMALSVTGRRNALSRSRLMAFASAVGLPERAATRALDDVLAATEGLADEVAAGVLPFDAARTRDLVRGLRSRRAVLL